MTKYFGVTVFKNGGHKIRRPNQNRSYCPYSNENLISYTHTKENRIIDDYWYRRYKKNFKKYGWDALSDYTKEYLKTKNPYYFRNFS